MFVSRTPPRNKQLFLRHALANVLAAAAVTSHGPSTLARIRDAKLGKASLSTGAVDCLRNNSYFRVGCALKSPYPKAANYISNLVKHSTERDERPEA